MQLDRIHRKENETASEKSRFTNMQMYFIVNQLKRWQKN